MYIDQTWDMKWLNHNDHFVRNQNVLIIIIQWTGNRLLKGLLPNNLYTCVYIIAMGFLTFFWFAVQVFLEDWPDCKQRYIS